MDKIFEEGNLRFDFTSFIDVIKYDNEPVPYGMKAVDFFAENADSLYFIEVKDYQHPNAPEKQRLEDFDKLVKASMENDALFNLEIGGKIKDSLLRRYAEGEKFEKEVIFILFINMDKLCEPERGLLMTKISGHVPTGLNKERFCAFSSIAFELVNAEQLTRHGITCTEKQRAII